MFLITRMTALSNDGIAFVTNTLIKSNANIVSLKCFRVGKDLQRFNLITLLMFIRY